MELFLNIVFVVFFSARTDIYLFVYLYTTYTNCLLNLIRQFTYILITICSNIRRLKVQHNPVREATSC